MGGSAGGSMGHAMSNMSGLAACNVSDSKPMQFPLTQRRKRRVLFTQAQVSKVLCLFSYALSTTNKWATCNEVSWAINCPVLNCLNIQHLFDALRL